MNRHRSMTVIAACCMALLALHCNKQPAPDTSAADEAAIRGISQSWSKAYNAGDADGVVALYADDAVLGAPGAPPARGRAAIRELIVKDIANAATAGITLNIPSSTDVGISNNLGWEWGTFTATDKSGATVDTGKYLSVFAKRDGKWLLIRDTWNSDGPMQAPPTKK